jgi:hypothetical protein
MTITKSGFGAAITLCGLGLSAASAVAAPLTVSSYSMFNGGTGSFNYQDFTYLPCPGADCVTTGAPLSGGAGKLTDGVSPPLSWYQYGQDTPWVGWDNGEPNGGNPLVTFNFAGVEHVNSVTVWVDNTIGAGGVYLPSSVSIDGTNFAIAPDNSNPSPRAYTFSNLGITGSSVNVQFFQSSGFPWIMVGEVSFDGTSTIPEPGSWAMMLLGFSAMGWAIRSRREEATVA